MKRQMLIVLVLAMLASGPAMAETNATLPYAVLYDAMVKPMDMHGLGAMVTNRERRVVITSKLPNVKPADIQLYIDSTNGKLPIAIGEEGVVQFPISEALREEGPAVIANQPKGTLNLEIKFSMTGTPPGVGSNGLPVVRDEKNVKIRYAQLFKTLAAVPSGASVTDSGTGEALGDASIAKEVRFTVKAKGGKLTIHGQGGDTVIEANPQGEFVIPFNADLYREDPWVSWPRTPKEGAKSP